VRYWYGFGPSGKVYRASADGHHYVTTLKVFWVDPPGWTAVTDMDKLVLSGWIDWLGLDSMPIEVQQYEKETRDAAPNQS
jgi:hypothetical protein